LKLCVLTSNQPRHISLVEEFCQIADEVKVFSEVSTLFPGQIDDFYEKSQVMQEYFSNVIEAEQSIFGEPRLWPANAKVLPMKMGDINKLSPTIVKDILKDVDTVIVFGASYIKSPIVEPLIDKKAINIHMGVSPYFRGASCNFWALYKKYPEFVGATIHLISKGLDSGSILFHCLPEPKTKISGFELGMLAVKSAILGLKEKIDNGSIMNMKPVPQDKSKEIAYTRNKDFTNSKAQEYLSQPSNSQEILKKIKNRDMSKFIKPFLIN
jgi:hypothetical protein